MSEIYGYIRVSTREQKIDRQVAALSTCGISEHHLFIDKQSGSDFNRPAYQRLLKVLKPGDLLVVKSIDRLGRDYEEIRKQWYIITQKLQANIQVLDIPLLNTGHQRDLTGTLISDIILQLLAYVAQAERENIRQRQAEGIAAARRRGSKLGRPAAEPSPYFHEVYTAWKNKRINSRQAARMLEISQTTFLKWKKKAEEQGGPVPASSAMRGENTVTT